MRKTVAVVGAGVIGLMAARALQRAGHQVTLLDPDPPGRGCSYGNAGCIATEHILPLARGAVLKQAPRMLLDPLAPFALRWLDLPALLPWFLRFTKACQPSQVATGTRAMAALLSRAGEAWEPEIRNAVQENLFRRSGCLFVFETAKGLAQGARDQEIQEKHGIEFETRTSDEVADELPGLSIRAAGGVFYPGAIQVSEPYQLSKKLFSAFQAEGGELLAQAVTGFDVRVGEIRSVRTRAGSFRFDQVVISAGVHSRALMESLGVKTPLVAERGYHVMIEGSGVPRSGPLTFYERSFYLTPMWGGLRLAGTAEFASLDAPANWKRADLLLKQTRELFPGLGGAATSRWLGNRPTLPDSLPALGKIPGLKNALAAYGHQHLGLTLAAVSGQIIADLVSNKKIKLDLAPFDPGRFQGP